MGYLCGIFHTEEEKVKLFKVTAAAAYTANEKM
jgi:hypothetical protein